MTVDVYNTEISSDNYIHSFEIPNYSQYKRIKNRMRQYMEYQGAKDLANKRMRFYIFVVNTSDGQLCWNESSLN